MLKGMEGNISGEAEILLELERLPFVFYLTGSRFDGRAHEDSDWDFFVEDDLSFKVGNLWESLTSLEFSLEPLKEMYLDNCTKYVFKRKGCSFFKGEHQGIEYVPQIHIQIVKDAKWKLEAQQTVLETVKDYTRKHIKIDKVMMMSLWDRALSEAGWWEERENVLLRKEPANDTIGGI